MKRICLAFSLLLLLAACTARVAEDRSRSVHLIGPGGKNLVLNAEIADSPEHQEQGLMFRKELGADAGMLFTFKQSRILSFWMKNTLIPLDIIFFDEKGSFVSSTTMEPCPGEYCIVYHSSKIALYALEVNKGYIKSNGIGAGWVVEVRQQRSH